jgi:hypothetical protein
VFGHKWESAQGKIVDSHLEQRAVDGKSGLHQVWVYHVDVRKPNGQQLRATVTGAPTAGTQLEPGTTVAVEVNSKTAEVRFDPDQVRVQISMRDPAAVAGLRQGQQPGAGMPGVQVFSHGQQPGAGLPGVQVVGGAQAAELMQELLAGGGDRAAALEKIKQLRSEITAQSGAPGQNWAQGQHGPPEEVIRQVRTWAQGQHGPQQEAPPQVQSWTSGQHGPRDASSPPAASTPPGPVAPPGPVTPPAATFSSPADAFGTPNSSLRPAGGSASPPASFSSPPVAPASFEPVSPGSTFGSPGGAGFSSGASFGSFGESKSDRIARLEDQRDHGQLTPEQFQAQRQRIMDEI